MPRQGRLDFTGALHHVIIRGVARARIFDDKTDYERFIMCMGELVGKTDTACFAWALLPNHSHLLLGTGKKPLSWFMQRLLTRYAIYYNLRHERIGHLFQNRYKSILCEKEDYLLELVRYIHLNPLRAGLVENLKELARYPWCGHGALTGEKQIGWQQTRAILGLFSRGRLKARGAYEEFLREGIKMGRREDLQGGGVVRSLGGMTEYIRRTKAGEEFRGDERILGSDEFIRDVLRDKETTETERSRLRLSGWDVKKVLDRVASLTGLEVGNTIGNGKRPKQCLARRLACKWLVEDLGYKEVDVARVLGIGQPAVSQSVEQGRKEELRLSLKLGM